MMLVQAMQPSSPTSNKKGITHDPNLLILDKWVFGEHGGLVCQRQMTIDDIANALSTLVKKVPMASQNAEEEQCEISRRGTGAPDLASDLAFLKLLSKEVYINLIKSMDIGSSSL